MADTNLTAKFTVDTHLFRELGELLVGRDSTALVELIKNAYDADATKVTIYGEGLSSPETGRILITDNGTGMSREQFILGFLRIASRFKEEGTRRSLLFGRRYTGAKGVGRLAAQKLARFMCIESHPCIEANPVHLRPIRATIDWDVVESKVTLDELEHSGAIRLEVLDRKKQGVSGTSIELSRLRRGWTAAERVRFFWEVETFRPPRVLVDVPQGTVSRPLLFKRPLVADSEKTDPGVDVILEGDFKSGEEYWKPLVAAASWIIEIDATSKGRVQFAVSPTNFLTKNGHPGADQVKNSIAHPDPKDGPFFQARIFVREGRRGIRNRTRPWMGQASGIRVYMEGFRVLPYGEQGDDWLDIDSDYVKRGRALGFLDDLDSEFTDGDPNDEDAALTFRRNDAYFGAVFLTQNKAASLRMVVNREGFVLDAALDTIKRIVRIAIDLSVRHGAAVRKPAREERKEHRSKTAAPGSGVTTERQTLRQEVEAELRRASEYAHEAEKKAAAGKVPEATELVHKAAVSIGASSRAQERLMSERAIMQILAAVGLQMSAYVHEINGLLGAANAIEDAAKSLRTNRKLDPAARDGLTGLSLSIGELRRIIERQASYLTDITSPDARRRRSRQKLFERFEAGTRIVKPAAERRGIMIENLIPATFESPPMFPAEMVLVFSNLLTNAIKAAGDEGRIRASASRGRDGTTKLRIENTGNKVPLADGERWFRPFESTTTELDPILGQGMGMGLPITRNILGEYGAEIRFVEPRNGFITAIEITFPKG